VSLDAGNILLVEDNPQDEELILRALKKQNLGDQVRVARDGTEALDLLLASNGEGRTLRENLKVILLDLKLPKISGMEVLKKIKQDERTKSIPVVCLTSSPEESDIKESYLLGCNSYVVKPVGFDEFTDTMGQLGVYWALLNRTAIDRQ
jgi:CheY-like chemotaxis protein